MNKKCWWSYANQCVHSKCVRNCYLFYPVLKGMLEKPDYGTFEVEKLLRIATDAERKSYEKFKRGGKP